VRNDLFKKTENGGATVKWTSQQWRNLTNGGRNSRKIRDCGPCVDNIKGGLTAPETKKKFQTKRIAGGASNFTRKRDMAKYFCCTALKWSYLIGIEENKRFQ